ncbi:MAG: S1 RNA-binding domain-containing protein [Candidatus Margulisiibacteriota bacterium]
MPIAAGSEVEGKVTGITNFGAFIELPGREVGLVHISQIADSYVKDINQHLKVGDAVKVKVLSMVKEGKYDLSIKLVGKNAPASAPPLKLAGPATLEDKIKRFLKTSEERQLDLKKNIEHKQGKRKKR